MKVIRIGTRGSQLALWQANLVKTHLEKLGHNSQIIEVSSTGDEILDKPLHQIGGYGLFTRTLDNKILLGEIDIAVHSLKDVPTDLPQDIVQAAVLKRGNTKDVLVLKTDSKFLERSENSVIATGSLRRKALWLDRYPNHTITGLRGNVNTRLQKLKDNNWNGAIFAAAGLERINLLPKNHIILDWMTPSPAQGTIMITALNINKDILDICSKLNHKETEIIIAIERQFMKTLEAGCTAPLGGIAKIIGDTIHFNGVLIAIDGSHKVEINKSTTINNRKKFGEICAKEVLDQGGLELMIKINSEMKK